MNGGHGMSSRYIVQQGDCISSIAVGSGFFPDKLWNLADNRELKALRKDMNVLLPGDVVVIPDLTLRTETRAADQRHRFRRKGVPKLLRLRFMDPVDPIANTPYTIDLDGVVTRGATDGDGWLKHPIAPDAKRALVRLKGHGEFDLQLGFVDPPNEPDGALGRLRALGYLKDGSEDDAAVERAIRTFQRDQGLPVDGKASPSLAALLKDVMGC